MKQFVMILLALLTVVSVTAQTNRLYMQDFEIYPDSVMDVPVMLANETPTRGFQCFFMLPEGLSLESNDVSSYSKSHKMTIVCQPKDNGYMVFVYSMDYVNYPADTAAVVVLTLRAASNFKGGEIVFSKVVGSSLDNSTFPIDGSATAVTVPASALIGVPIDQQRDDQIFF